MILLLMIVFSLGFSLGGVYLGIYARLSDTLEKSIVEKNEVVVNMVSFGLRQIIRMPEEVLLEMAASHHNNCSCDTDQLQIIHESHAIIEDLMILNGQGIVEDYFPFDSTMIGLDMSRQDFFKDADTTPVWSRSFLSPDSARVTVAVSMQVRAYVYVANIRLQDLVGVFSVGGVGQRSFQVILDRDGTVLAHQDSSKVLHRENLSILEPLRDLGTDYLLTDSVEYEGQSYISTFYRLPHLNWIVGYFNNEDDAYKPLHLLRRVILVTLAISLTLTLITAFLILHTVSHAVNRIWGYTALLADGHYQTPLPTTNIDEFDHLLNQLGQTGRAVQEREKQLQNLMEILEDRVSERTRELKENMEDLKRTQDKLILSEKMAALGGLVAGVAHEINTPIGVGVTAASHIRNKKDEIKELLDSDNLSREEFEDFLDLISESSDLILSNMRRASQLINSFKKVAVDQQMDELSSFELGSYLRDILNSLSPQFKAGHHSSVMLGDKSVMMNSYPGALAQIISNLVINSLIHGFEGLTEKQITISYESVEDRAIIHYRDNGVGISQKIRKQIFDPFFTTKRHKGGTGLGMHIVFNLVHQKLGGTIDLQESDEGVCFRIDIPLSC